jgi:hypothetical protein
VRLEGLGQLENPMASSRMELRDLPVCSVVPQQTTLPRALYTSIYSVQKITIYETIIMSVGLYGCETWFLTVRECRLTCLRTGC